MESAEVKEEGIDMETPREAEMEVSNDLGHCVIVHSAIVHKEVKENPKNCAQQLPGKDDITSIDRQRIFLENRKRDSFIHSKRHAAENDIFIEELEYTIYFDLVFKFFHGRN